MIGFPALAATSMDQGRLATYHAFGEPTDGMTELQPIGIYSIPAVSYVGATEVELTRDAIPYEVRGGPLAPTGRRPDPGDSYGMLKLLVSTYDLTLLGVLIFGSNATEMVHIKKAVMGCGGDGRLPGGRGVQLPDVLRGLQGRRAGRREKDTGPEPVLS